MNEGGKFEGADLTIQGHAGHGVLQLGRSSVEAHEMQVREAVSHYEYDHV